MFILLFGLACSSGPKSLKDQCVDDHVADACFLYAFKGESPRSMYFGLGAEYGNAASDHEPRHDWPLKEWTVTFDPADLPEVLHGYAAACDLGYGEACYELGNFLALEGNAPLAAVGPYHKACQLGVEHGCWGSGEVEVPMYLRRVEDVPKAYTPR